MNTTADVPKLIDFQTGHYLMNTLRQCHDTRVLTYSRVFNTVIVVVFLLFASITLYICFTRKKTPDEKQQQMEQEQKFILEKIKSLKVQKLHYLQEGSFTKLPIPG